MRSTGASRKPSKPPSSWSATNSRLVPSIAANSSVTQSTPAASVAVDLSRCSPKWKTTSVVDAEQRHRRDDLAACAARAAAPCAAARRRRRGTQLTGASLAPARSSRAGRRPAAAASGRGSSAARPPRSPSARSASARPAGGVVAGRARACARGGPDQRLDELGGRGVEVRARLVEQQQRRGRAAPRGRPRRAAPSRASSVCTRLVGAAAQADARRAAPRRASAATPCSRAWKRRFSRAREVAVEQRLVGQQPDPPAARPSRRRGASRRARARARVRAQQRREHAQQRRLAGAVRAQDDERRARRRGSSVTSGERDPLAVAALEPVELNAAGGAATIAHERVDGVARAPAR